MLLGLEIGLICGGLYALVTGKFPLTRNQEVSGAGARLLGLIAIMPLGLVFCVAFVVGFDAGLHRRSIDPSLKATINTLEVVAVVCGVILVCGLATLMTWSPRRPAPYAGAPVDTVSSCLPSRSGNEAPVASFQGAVPLRTMAYVQFQRPRPVKRPATGCGLCVWGCLLIFSFFLLLCVTGRLPTGDHPSAEAANEVPAEVAPQLLIAGTRVYLSDLPDFGWKGADGWTLGRGGNLGNLAQPKAVIVIQSRTPAKGLSMQPPSVGYASVSYYLGRRAQTLDAKVCLIATDKQTKPDPTRFEVFGDGQLLWRSRVIASLGEIAGFSDKDVSQVNVLELRTRVESGDGQGAHAVWLNPFVDVRREAKTAPPP
jgi:hypothetical protein